MAEVSGNRSRPILGRTVVKALALLMVIALMLIVNCYMMLRRSSEEYIYLDQALLDEQSIYTACLDYRKREGKLPSRIEDMNYSTSQDNITSPWGKPYQLEIWKNPETGLDVPVIWTTDNQGKRIEWPHR